MKSLMKFLVLFLIILNGCISTKEITKKSELKNAYRIGDVVALATDSSIYKFEKYKYLDSVIIGKGIVQKNGKENEFEDTIKLKDLSYIQLRYVNTTNTIIAFSAVAVVGGLAYSYLQSDNTLAVNEVIYHYYPYSGGGGGGGGSSCPLIYSFDGEKYILESETFAGSIFKAAERVCYDNLEHLKSVNGILNIKLANEMLETDYINELRLLSVDYPEDVLHVIPTIDGRIHTIKEEITPNHGYDFSGNNITNIITKKDSLNWESILDGKDFNNKNDLRDGMVLEFPKPNGLNNCKLVVCGKNTDLGNYAISQLTKLNGNNILEWYQSIESDPVKGFKVIEWMMREGLLRISVWNGEKWIEQGAIIDPGPLLYNDFLTMLDIKKVKGDTLKIKLETALDLWIIDQVYIDYSEDIEINITELDLIKANENITNKNISQLINADDRDYYSALPGQYVLLQYKAPDISKSYKRTYIIKTKGYYHPWVNPDEKYQPELIEQILDEPLFGSTLYMDSWRKLKLNGVK